MMGTLWAAAAETDSLDVVLPLVERFGLPLVFLALFLTGQIVTKRAYDAMKADRDAERASREQLQTTIVDDVVPALTRSTDATTAANAINERIIRRLSSGNGGGGE